MTQQSMGVPPSYTLSVIFATMISAKQRHRLSGVRVIGQSGEEKSAKSPQIRMPLPWRGSVSHFPISAFPRDLTVGT